MSISEGWQWQQFVSPQPWHPLPCALAVVTCQSIPLTQHSALLPASALLEDKGSDLGKLPPAYQHLSEAAVGTFDVPAFCQHWPAEAYWALYLLQWAGSPYVFLTVHLSTGRKSLSLTSPVWIVVWKLEPFEHWKHYAAPAVWVFGCYQLEISQPEETGGGRVVGC